MDDVVDRPVTTLWPARAGRRIPAFLIDLGVRLVVGGSAGYAVYGLLGPAPAPAIGGAAAVFVAVFIGYQVVMLTWNQGRTVGKAARGLRVVRRDGAPLRLRHALLRALGGPLGVLDQLAWLLDWLPWYASGWTDGETGLGDRLAGTVVIDERLAAGQPAEVR